MNSYAIYNLIKACEIISIPAEQPNRISVIELEKLVHITGTTAFRILKKAAREQN